MDEPAATCDCRLPNRPLAWLDAHEDELAPAYDAPGTLDEQIAQMQRVKSILFDAGWMRYGWPERVGGLGGSPMLRNESARRSRHGI